MVEATACNGLRTFSETDGFVIDRRLPTEEPVVSVPAYFSEVSFDVVFTQPTNTTVAPSPSVKLQPPPGTDGRRLTVAEAYPSAGPSLRQGREGGTNDTNGKSGLVNN